MELYPQTPESIKRAKAAQRYERMLVALETGWICTADGKLIDPCTVGVKLGEAMAMSHR